MKTYDMMFIFDTALKDEALEGVLARVTGEITRLGGAVIDTTHLGERTFARVMQKRDAGQYIKLRVDLDPVQVAPLQARLKLIEEIFRVQVLVGGEEEVPVVGPAADDKEPRDA